MTELLRSYHKCFRRLTYTPQGSPPQNEKAGDKFIVVGNQALGRAITVALFVHLELDVTIVFIA